jgi:hypothetical protein
MAAFFLVDVTEVVFPFPKNRAVGVEGHAVPLRRDEVIGGPLRVGEEF